VLKRCIWTGFLFFSFVDTVLSYKKSRVRLVNYVYRWSKL
jgi:hypothetical protein